jgi:hypothetical protein
MAQAGLQRASKAEAQARDETKAAQARFAQVSLLAAYGWAGRSDPWLYENAVAANVAIEPALGIDFT